MSIIPAFLGRKGSKTSGHESLAIEILPPFESFSFTPLATGPLATARMAWKETPDAHVFVADLPGLNKDEMKVEVEEEKSEKWHRVERSSDRFIRGVRLPVNANTDKTKDVLENGVLTVTVPTEHEAKAQWKFIEIGG